MAASRRTGHGRAEHAGGQLGFLSTRPTILGSPLSHFGERGLGVRGFSRRSNPTSVSAVTVQGILRRPTRPPTPVHQHTTAGCRFTASSDPRCNAQRGVAIHHVHIFWVYGGVKNDPTFWQSNADHEPRSWMRSHSVGLLPAGAAHRDFNGNSFTAGGNEYPAFDLLAENADNSIIKLRSNQSASHVMAFT